MSKHSSEDFAQIASLAVRSLAHELNVDLTIVTPTGEDGQITTADVQRVHRVLTEVGPLQRISGARKAMAKAMARSRDEVVHSSVSDDACLAAWGPPQRVTLRLIRAISAAVKVEPALNAWFDAAEIGRRLLPKIHLGVTVETPEGQFVCVLQDIASRNADSLRKGLDKMREAVNNHAIPPEELRGYTITLSNLGKLGGRYATPAIAPPTVAVVAAGRARDAVVALKGETKIARVLPLCVTFDHRAVTGGEAARFLSAMIADLELPA